MHYLEETLPTSKELKECIRKLVIDRKFVPTYVGSAYKNKGVQTLLDGVIEYLPSPLDIKHFALDPSKVRDTHHIVFLYHCCKFRIASLM